MAQDVRYLGGVTSLAPDTLTRKQEIGEQELNVFNAVSRAYQDIGYVSFPGGIIPSQPDNLIMKSVSDDILGLDSNKSLLLAGGAFVESDPEKLPTFQVLNSKNFIPNYLKSLQGKVNFIELGRFFYSGVANYVRSELDNPDFLPGWSDKKLSSPIKLFKRLQLLSQLAEVVEDNNVGVAILNCSHGGFVTPKVSNHPLFIRGAYDMVKEVTTLKYIPVRGHFLRVEGMMIPASWKKTIPVEAEFMRPYIEAHPALKENEPNLFIGILLFKDILPDIES